MNQIIGGDSGLTKKSLNVIVVGKCPFVREPHWYMEDKQLQNEDKLDILGNIWNTSGYTMYNLTKLCLNGTL